MSDRPWKDAIIEVLSLSEGAMHYADIAEMVVEMGLRESVGATPKNTVNAYIGSSLNDEKDSSPFIRVGRGVYFLRSKSQAETSGDSAQSSLIDSGERGQNGDSIVNAFGMYWQRDSVLWNSKPDLLGKQQVGADFVNFTEQKGVYLLYDGRAVVYVGRSIDRPLGRRLYEHTQDRLRGRWDRFSWFGLLTVTDSGELQESSYNLTQDIIISTLEALLIEGLEPPQNRKRGDDFNAVEYLQAEDPKIEKNKMKKFFSEMQTKFYKD